MCIVDNMRIISGAGLAGDTMAKAFLAFFLLALAGTTFAEDFTATLSPSAGGATAEGQAPTGKLALTLDQDGKYTLTLSNIKDFTDVRLPGSHLPP
jgi:hypothetical protein